MSYSSEFLRGILRSTKVIACVGMSPNPVRPSYFVGRFLALRNYRVIPVHPAYAGTELWGERVYADMSEIPVEVHVDMLDIFRRSEFVPPIVDAAIEHFPHLKTVWMQISVENAQAAAVAEARGLAVVQNKCPKMEYQRHFGELRKAGINTGIISSRL